jgi:predicted nucleic acid-binding Zn ribbon protein
MRSRYTMARQDDFTPLNKILDNFFKNKGFGNDLSLHIIKKNWNKIIGNQLFEHTSPFMIEKDTLIIKCDHQGWITSLSFYKKEILNKINVELNGKGEILDIKFIFKNTKINN